MPEQDTFSLSAWSDDSGDLAVRDGQIQAIEDVLAAKGFMEVCQSDHGVLTAGSK
jgi:hypothetical protein